MSKKVSSVSAVRRTLLTLGLLGAADALADGLTPMVGPWTSLIDADPAHAWRGWRSAGFPAGWCVERGMLLKQGEVDDLVCAQEYGSFELQFEWKVGQGANSGVFFHGTREYDQIYWSAPEYQLLDDAFASDGANRLTAAGAAYGLYAAPAGVVRPFGHWNQSRLTVRGPRVEHWLQGRRIVAYELLGEAWRQRVAASKFAAYPHYGKASRGLLGIQGDHQGALALRAMRIRALG